jgi:molybdopterin converting factor small subunit
MAIKIKSFGQLVPITGGDLVLEEGIADTDSLKHWMEDRHPGLAQLKYVVAVDKNIIGKNTVLTDGVTVALLPPFSGG